MKTLKATRSSLLVPALTLFFLFLAQPPAQAEPFRIDDKVNIVCSPRAGPWEKRAADDLSIYIEKITGIHPGATAGAGAPTIVLGSEALKESSKLQAMLNKVKKKNPVVRADAIAFVTAGNTLYVAGSNDESNYYAAMELLHRWGCRLP